MDKIPTGIDGFDDVLDGFRVGDNIILENAVSAPPYSFLHAVIEASLERGDEVLYATFDASPAAVVERLGELASRVRLLDCFTHGHGSAPGTEAKVRAQDVVVHAPYYASEFQADIQELTREPARRIFIMDSLNGMALLWGEERVRAFYAHMCPRLFDLGDLALWVLHQGVQSQAFHAQIGHIAQAVLSLDREEGLAVRVDRAVGRDARLLEWVPAVEDEEGFRVIPQGAPKRRRSM